VSANVIETFGKKTTKFLIIMTAVVTMYYVKLVSR